LYHYDKIHEKINLKEERFILAQSVVSGSVVRQYNMEKSGLWSKAAYPMAARKQREREREPAFLFLALLSYRSNHLPKTPPLNTTALGTKPSTHELLENIQDPNHIRLEFYFV
jgi:hypothetical protein